MCVGGSFLARIQPVGAMRNTLVRSGKGKEGGRGPCLDEGSVGAGAFFSNCLTGARA